MQDGSQDDMEMDERVLETSNPAGGRQLDKFTRELRLRRADEAITKAVKENNWKLADELEIKYHQELKRQQDQDAAHGPQSFYLMLKHISLQVLIDPDSFLNT